jgi:GNAT superfamily N-acetyltransferase
VTSAEEERGVLVCARADARFHELAFAAHGITVLRASGLWWVRHSAAPYFMTAGTLSASVTSSNVLARVSGEPSVSQVRDCWGRLDLTEAGFVAQVDDRWMVRPPGAPPEARVPGLVIRRAQTPHEVLQFERTAVLGTGDGPPRGYRDGDIHPAATTATDGDLHLFTGLLDGDPVATALAAVRPDVVMIGAVRTRPDVRGRGIGTAMTTAAVAAAPDRAAALGARSLAEPLYRRLGFVVCGRGLVWRRVTPARQPAGSPV